MRKVRLLDEAVTDAIEAASWYEQECSGLGIEFADAINAALDLLEEEIVPLTNMPGVAGEHGVKRLVLARFPYDVAAVQLDHEILIVAIAHHARAPGYWMERNF